VARAGAVRPAQERPDFFDAQLLRIARAVAANEPAKFQSISARNTAGGDRPRHRRYLAATLRCGLEQRDFQNLEGREVDFVVAKGGTRN